MSSACWRRTQRWRARGSLCALCGGRSPLYHNLATFAVIGKPETVRQAFDATCAGGTACMVGVPPTGGEVSVPMRPLFLDRRLIGSSAGTGRPRVDFPWFIELYRQGRLKIDELQSRSRPLDEIIEAFEDMLSGEVARTIVRP